VIEGLGWAETISGGLAGLQLLEPASSRRWLIADDQGTALSRMYMSLVRRQLDRQQGSALYELENCWSGGCGAAGTKRRSRTFSRCWCVGRTGATRDDLGGLQQSVASSAADVRRGIVHRSLVPRQWDRPASAVRSMGSPKNFAFACQNPVNRKIDHQFPLLSQYLLCFHAELLPEASGRNLSKSDLTLSLKPLLQRTAREENMLKLLGPNEAIKIVSLKEFRSRFRDPLFTEIILPTVARRRRGWRKDELEELGEVEIWLYDVARYLVHVENRINIFGKTAKIVRPHRIKLDRVLAHLKNSAQQLEQAASIAQREREQGLARGFLDFRTPRAVLRKVTTKVNALRRYIIRHLPPDHRTQYENRTIPLSRTAIAHARRLCKFSALRDEVIMEIVAKLKKLTKGWVSDSNINRVISAFFAAIGQRVEVGNVKTIRHRLTLQKRTNEDSASPPTF
jgi:hypothetical protein